MPLHVSAGKIKKIWRTDDEAVLHEIKNLWTDQGQVFSSVTIEVHEVSRSGMIGLNTFHSLITLSPPPGEVWQVEVEGNFSGDIRGNYPSHLRVGSGQSEGFLAGPVAYSGDVTSADSRVGVVTTTAYAPRATTFVGTVTVTKP